jgi:hypothetical protein
VLLLPKNVARPAIGSLSPSGDRSITPRCVMHLTLELASILLQLGAMVLALRLIRLSGRSLAWIFITVAIAGMEVRRIVSLYHTMMAQPELDVPYSAIGLATSACMVVGVALIAPIFVSLRRSQEEQQQLIGELREAMSQVQTLKGFLPICASCKKIRDDDGYWTQIETYIRDHSEAEFSHGLCPDCARTLYPDLFTEGASGAEPGSAA